MLNGNNNKTKNGKKANFVPTVLEISHMRVRQPFDLRRTFQHVPGVTLAIGRRRRLLEAPLQICAAIKLAVS